LVHAINPEVTIIHVQKADRSGNCRIEGLTFADVEQAKAAKHLVVTCETLCDNDELKKGSNQNQIPFIHVDAVVHVPNGAFPTACYMHYDYDPQYLHMYADHAKDDEMYQAYLDRYVYAPQTHGTLVELMGAERMARLAADPRTGYAANLDRR
jgi:glutaconate CoA-transferase subunit A